MTGTGADDRYVFTIDIQTAVKGRETEILDALGVPYRDGRPHINCPFRDHTDNNPSWRWDERRGRTICTCGSDSILYVLVKVEGIDLDAAKLRAAEILNRTDLVRERRKNMRPRRKADGPATKSRLVV